GVIPLTETIFTWQSAVTAIILMIVSTFVAYLSAPPASKAMTAASLGVKEQQSFSSNESPRTPGEWLEHSWILTAFIAAIGFLFLARLVYHKGARGRWTSTAITFSL